LDSQDRKTTILVVDDNEANRYILCRALTQAGYAVIEAADGEEALRQVQQKPDLVTLDVHLPDISGIEVCRQIKAAQDLRSIPVIHVSATFVQSKHRVDALNSGADGYLTQPLEDVVLIATVRAFLRARQAEKEREELLAQSRRDLEALRMERDLRERFVATLTHDLRTPLTAAKISAQMILRLPDTPEPAQRLVGRVRDNIDRAVDMIRDLLDANRIRAGESLPIEAADCELRRVLEETLDGLSSSHGDRFVLRAPAQVRGFCDVGAVKRIIENLAENAVKYGEKFAPITVTVTELPQAVDIAVHNQGNPIPEAELRELFKPYSRRASAQQSGHKGWGLGLTLVQGMAEAHGGRVQVTSAAESGTTFTVTLPREATNVRQLIPLQSRNH
jgi:signal transduction histidine kinase